MVGQARLFCSRCGPPSQRSPRCRLDPPRCTSDVVTVRAGPAPAVANRAVTTSAPRPTAARNAARRFRPRDPRGPAGREGEGRKSRVLIILPRSGSTPSHDPGGRLRPSGPERPGGPVERPAGGFVRRIHMRSCRVVPCAFYLRLVWPDLSFRLSPLRRWLPAVRAIAW
jgi:hypothetical protein